MVASQEHGTWTDERYGLGGIKRNDKSSNNENPFLQEGEEESYTNYKRGDLEPVRPPSNQVVDLSGDVWVSNYARSTSSSSSPGRGPREQTKSSRNRIKGTSRSGWRGSSRSFLNLGWRRFVRATGLFLRKISPKSVARRARNCYGTCAGGESNKERTTYSVKEKPSPRRSNGLNVTDTVQSIRDYFQSSLRKSRDDVSKSNNGTQDHYFTYQLLGEPKFDD